VIRDLTSPSSLAFLLTAT